MNTLNMTSQAAADARLRNFVAKAEAGDTSALHDIENVSWPTRADGYAKANTLMTIQKIAGSAQTPEDKAQALSDIGLLASQFDTTVAARHATLATLVTRSAAFSTPQVLHDVQIAAGFEWPLYQEFGNHGEASLLQQVANSTSIDQARQLLS